MYTPPRAHTHTHTHAYTHFHCSMNHEPSSKSFRCNFSYHIHKRPTPTCESRERDEGHPWPEKAIILRITSLNSFLDWESISTGSSTASFSRLWPCALVQVGRYQHEYGIWANIGIHPTPPAAVCDAVSAYIRADIGPFVLWRLRSQC